MEEGLDPTAVEAASSLRRTRARVAGVAGGTAPRPRTWIGATERDIAQIKDNHLNERLDTSADDANVRISGLSLVLSQQEKTPLKDRSHTQVDCVSAAVVQFKVSYYS